MARARVNVEAEVERRPAVRTGPIVTLREALQQGERSVRVTVAMKRLDDEVGATCRQSDEDILERLPRDARDTPTTGRAGRR